MPTTYRTRKAKWDLIQADYESGDLSADELAQKWSLRAGTIRSRASREKWKTPNRIKQAIGAVVELVPGVREAMQQIATAGATEGKMQISDATPMGVPEYQAIVAEIAMRAVRNGLVNAKRPSNWREIATADTIARRALGLDSKGGGGASAIVRVHGPGGPVVDVAVTADAPEDDEDWEE